MEERRKSLGRKIQFFIGFVLPFLVMICSNVLLWIEVRSSTTYLRGSRYETIYIRS